MNSIIQGDCLDVMDDMESDSVDLIISDPPYNASKGNELSCQDKGWDKLKEDWDSFTQDEYFQFTIKWIKKAKDILKSGGSIFIFGSYHNIGFVNVTLQKLNMDMLNEIVWYKRDAFPNVSCTRLTASHESILWAYKGEDKDYTFNYDWMKETNWADDVLDERNKQVRTVWNISKNKDDSETKHGSHPTQKPRSLIDRLVLMASNKDDTVLDPFAGSGTTLVSAKRHGRKYIGIEKQEEFIDLCQDRLENTIEKEEEVEAGLMEF